MGVSRSSTGGQGVVGNLREGIERTKRSFGVKKNGSGFGCGKIWFT